MIAPLFVTPIGQTKTCTKCHENKDLSLFRKDSHKASGYGSYCKKCGSEQRRVAYLRDPAKATRSHYEWVKKNRDHLRAYTKSRQPEATEYARNRRQTSTNTKVADNLRRRINSMLSRESKTAPSLTLLGCTYDFFVHWIESQFSQGMSWSNYGREGWHIDHIKPCASFDLTDPAQQKECFHWSNMQPLWARNNRLKTDTIGPAIDYQI